MKVVKFDQDDVDAIIATLSQRDLDDLPFGAVNVDASGRIISFNKAEGDIVGVDPKAVIGKNFFTEVAPCANVPEFEGRFRDGVSKGDLHTMFEFEYDFGRAPLTNGTRHKVRIHMKKAIVGDTFWILAKRL